MKQSTFLFWIPALWVVFTTLYMFFLNSSYWESGICWKEEFAAYPFSFVGALVYGLLITGSIAISIAFWALFFPNILYLPGVFPMILGSITFMGFVVEGYVRALVYNFLTDGKKNNTAKRRTSSIADTLLFTDEDTEDNVDLFLFKDNDSPDNDSHVDTLLLNDNDSPEQTLKRQKINSWKVLLSLFMMVCIFFTRLIYEEPNEYHNHHNLTNTTT